LLIYETAPDQIVGEDQGTVKHRKEYRVIDSNDFFPATGMPDKDWWQTLWPEPGDVLQQIGISAGMTVVDLCCGDGHFTAPLARLVSPGKVIAVDLDATMLEQARNACAGLSNCEFIHADARDLSKFSAVPADHVLIANTFHGVPDKTALAQSAFSVLRQAGHFTVINWYPLPREQTTVLGQPRGPATNLRMSPEAVTRTIEPAGFIIERIVDLPPYHYAAIFIRP
jgi:SAM-dependent methyltransferase